MTHAVQHFMIRPRFHAAILDCDDLLRRDSFTRLLGRSRTERPTVNMASASEKGSRINCMSRTRRRFLVMLFCAGSLVAPAASRAAELKEETLKTWDAYTQTVNSQMRDRLQGSFLWVDEEPDRLHRIRAGEILISPVGRQIPKPVPSGLIHDWIGAAFIPDARLEDVVSAVRDYGDYKEFYKPTVVDSKSLVLRPLDYVTKLVSGPLACELPLYGNPVAIHTTIPGPSLLAQASDVSDSAFA